MNNVITTDLSEFGHRERVMLADTLKAWNTNGLPERMGNNVRAYLNKNSGYVFLSDDDGNTCMESDGQLLLHLSTPYEGHEGFAMDLASEASEDWHSEDLEYLADALAEEGQDEEAKRIREMIK